MPAGTGKATSLNWSGLWNRLRIRLAKDTLDISSAGGYWKKRVEDLVNSHNQVPSPEPDSTLTSHKQLEQAKTFQDLGLVASAQYAIEKIQFTPPVQVPPEVHLANEIAEKWLALRVGAGFLLVNVGLTLFAIAIIISKHGMLNPGLPISAVIDAAIGVNLWRGHVRQWAALAVFRAGAGLLLFGLMSLSRGDILGFVLQAAFCSSLILVLIGKGNRLKTWTAAGVFAISCLGILFVFLTTAL